MPASPVGPTPRSPLLLLRVASVAAALLWLLAWGSAHSLLFPAGPNFADVLVYKGRFTLFHTARFFTSRAFSAFAYPAGAAPLYAFLYSTADPLLTYLLFAASAVCVALAASFVTLQKLGQRNTFWRLLPLGFPLVFLVQRANLEIVLWAIVAMALLAHLRGHKAVAGALFGAAAAVKLYPVLMLGLYIRPRRMRSRQDLRALAVGVGTALFSTAAAILYAGPTFATAARGFFTGVDRFQDHYVDTVTRTEVVFDHCLFAPFKYLALQHHVSPAPWRPVYYGVALVLAASLFARVCRFPTLNRIVFLATAMVCLPPVSFAYTLVHLYLPMLLLLGALLASALHPAKTAMAALALLCFVLLPLPALTALGAIPTGPLQSCALLALLIACAAQPWQRSDEVAT